MSYSGYPPGPPGGPPAPGYPPAQQGYPPGPPAMGMPQVGASPGYPPPPGPGAPQQPWIPGGGGGGGVPYGMPGMPPSGPIPYPGGGAPSYPPPQSGSLGFGAPPPSQPGPAPYPPPTQQYPPPPSQQYPSPPSAGYPVPAAFYPTTTSKQTPGGYQTAPPPVPSATTHQHATSSRHRADVAQATRGVASMSVATYKEPHTEGTVKPSAGFNAEADARIIRTAMKGFGTDEKAIINILAYRSNQQRQEIKLKFKALFGKDMIKELKSELGGHFEKIVLGLLMTHIEFDAFVLHSAIKGAGTDESALIEVLCTRSNEEISDIKQWYKSEYKQSLENAVKSDTSGHFKRLLVSMLTGARDPNGPVDKAKARADAQMLYQAGEAKWGTDESKFNQVLAARSCTHLRAVFDEYSKICKYDIEQSISREMSGDLEEGMLTVVKAVRDKPAYFAERLYKSMKGLGTDDSSLVRVMVSRCEVDMVQIRKAFYTKYFKSLGSFIKGDTSGDYKRILLILAGDE